MTYLQREWVGTKHRAQLAAEALQRPLHEDDGYDILHIIEYRSAVLDMVLVQQTHAEHTQRPFSEIQGKMEVQEAV